MKSFIRWTAASGSTKRRVEDIMAGRRRFARPRRQRYRSFREMVAELQNVWRAH